MEKKIQKITPFLWFNEEAEEAAAFYTAIFGDSRIVSTTYYGSEGAEVTGKPKGSVMTVAFELEGQQFVALNGGPEFTFNEAVSFVVNCESQEEVDHYWEALSKGGDERAQQCGWLKDRFGVSWQIVPAALYELIGGPDPERSGRVMKAMLQMKKLDVERLKEAARSV